MKALSSVDIHCLAKELKSLEGSRVDNIYQKGKEEFLFQLHKTSEGKKLLRILMGKALFLTSHKGEMETLSGFCMLLRKHLGNAGIASISQIEPERIIRITFEAKEGTYHLYIEFLGKGNIVLCKEDGTIIDALLHQEFKDRTIAPKQKYKHPQMEYNVFTLDFGYLSSLLTSTSKGSLVKCLVIDLGLGGVYGEEVCANAKVDKNRNPHELDPKEKSSLLGAIKDLVKHPMEPIVVMKDGTVSEVFPFKLNTFSKQDGQSFSSLSEGLEHYYSNAREQVSTPYDSKVAELRRITEQQEKNIVELLAEEGEQRAKAEAIYSNYAQVKALLDELKAISKKHSWQDIQKKLKGHALIKEVNPKDKSVVVELGEKSVL